MLRHILILAAILLTVYCRRVLIVSPAPSHSHAALGSGLLRALLKYSPNTEITYITAIPEKSPQKGVKEVVISGLTAILDINVADNENKNSVSFAKELTTNITNVLLESPEFRREIIDKQYDAVITTWFFSDVHAGIAAVLQCPWILVGSTVMHPHLEYLIDTIGSPAVLPIMNQNLPLPMNFWQRMKNTFAAFAMSFLFQFRYYGETVSKYEDYYGELARARGVELPKFNDALHNVSLLLINSHPSISNAQALPPNAVEVGGYHIDEDTPKLPDDLQKLLDNAKGGVVYFSMGSILKSSKLPLQMRKDLLQVLGELPYTVLWKFEEDMQDKPKNVHIIKWAPQQSVLAHPNLKLFITHGGQLSTLEAVHFGVPVLAVPVFGDQTGNADTAVSNGFAVKVPFSDDVAKELRVALKEMLGHTRYSNRAKELSRLFRNRPVSPSKLIAHYVDLVIESKGALHLRSKARLYPFYQRYLLDQLAFVVGILILLCYSLKKIVKLCKNSKNKVKVQ